MSRPMGRHRIVAAAAAVLVQCTCVPLLAAEVRTDVLRDTDTLVFRASAVIDTDPDLAWRVLTDYGRYAEFIPGLSSSEVLRRDGNAVTVQQAANAMLGPLRLPLSVRYEIAESPRDHLRSIGSIGDVGVLDSDYFIRRAGNRVLIDYAGRFRVRSGMLRAVEEAAGRQTIDRQFRALVDEIERRGAVEQSCL